MLIRKKFFDTEQSGKPKSRYKIETRIDDNGRSQIVNPDHSALVFNHLKKVSGEMDKLFNLIATKDLSRDSITEAMHQIEDLEAHGRKIAAQAFYLDTSDRNGWDTVRQEMMTRGDYIQNPDKLLSKYWHGVLEKYIEDKPSRKVSYDHEGVSL